ncbi:hypothetical protein JZ751_014375 [Albula glossodonta]|uniref:G-protein coupled receptors family 1 profile domain-containing protein n=1 Tax=Albula glossodonta TaxID=121402 RepID=A0A8T2NTA0_9TELE|nr:hypothetical protein JZ751_014375 [Albula glossodonta]
MSLELTKNSVISSPAQQGALEMDGYNCSYTGFPMSPEEVQRCFRGGACNHSSAPLLSNQSLPMEAWCLSREQYLLMHLGPRRSPIFLPVCITYLVIFLVGAMGNALTCTVIVRNKVMRTPTNYYLFSLAVSDLLVLLLGMPLELYEMWSNYPFLLGQAGCYFKTFLFETVCFASVLNVTALSVERYVAVVHPLRAKYVVTRAHAKRVILSVWGVAMLCAVPNTSLHGVVPLLRSFPESAVCTLVKPRWMYCLLIQVTTVLFFLVPMLSLSILYLLIGLRLRRQRALRTPGANASLCQGGCSATHSRHLEARRQQVTKMLLIDAWTDQLKQVFEFVHVISGVFFYLSSVVNPILYSLMSTRFRAMFRETACQRQHRRYRPSRTQPTAPPSQRRGTASTLAISKMVITVA